MRLFEELGLPRVINAAATLTRLGGSIMPEPVVAAMVEASRTYLPLDEMQIRVGQRIAELTRNEAAYVSSGAAAGIALSVCACISGSDPVKIGAFPYLEHADRNEVIVVRDQRNGYDYAARQTGARLVEVDASLEAIEAACSPKTACVLWFAGRLADGSPPLADVIASAHAHNIPVVVDAAAQIPPVSNLWHFTTELGADLAIFSGGKGLRGPQSSGLILGRVDLITACRLNGPPNASLGRPMKVGKEELAGALAAVDWTLQQDEQALLDGYETVVHGWIEDLSRFSGIRVECVFPSEAGQPMPRTMVHFVEGGIDRRDDVIRQLRDGNPRIEVSTDVIEPAAIFLNPQTLQPGDETIVSSRLSDILRN